MPRIFRLCVLLLICIFDSLPSAEIVRADVEIQGFEDLSLHLAPQKDAVACWAASMSAALKVKKIDLTQDDIRTAVDGSPRMSSLTDPLALTQGVNSLLFGNEELHSVIVTVPEKYIPWPKFRSEIRKGNPFLVLYWLSPTNAHCIIVYGAVTNDQDQPVVYKIWDPEPGAGLNTMSLAELDSRAWCFLIVKSATLSSDSANERQTPDDSSDVSSADSPPSPSQEPNLSAKLAQILSSYSVGFADLSGDVIKDNSIARITVCTLKLYDEKGSISQVKGNNAYSVLNYSFDDQSLTDARHRFWQIIKTLRPTTDQGWNRTIKNDSGLTDFEFAETAPPHRSISVSVSTSGGTGNVALFFTTEKKSSTP